MKALGALQGVLASLYRVELPYEVGDFVRPLGPDDPDAHRDEVVLVAEEGDDAGVAVCIAPRVMDALAGREGTSLSRFDAWCAAVEGVSHFMLLAWRAEHARPVSQLDLELQADVDKYALGVLQRATGRAPGEARRSSMLLRRALFDRAHFRDARDTPRGQRYRYAHRLAARYTASLERRHVSSGRLGRMVEELRDFYRSAAATRYEMAAR